MQIEQLMAMMNDTIYEKFVQAIETGKWLDGKPLSEEQKETVMQAILVYQSKVKASEEHMTVGENGEIVHKSKRELRQEFQESNTKHQNIARFKQDDF